MKRLMILFFLFSLFGKIFAERELVKAWCGDTSKVSLFVTGYYEHCQKLISDTTYFVKYEATDNDSANWIVYYDKGMKKKASEFYHLGGDTIYHIYYYKNGQKKDFEESAKYLEIRKQQWCENGTLTFDGGALDQMKLSHEVNYYCNGKKSFTRDYCAGRLWGTATTYYESGNVECIQHFTEFSDSAFYGKVENKCLNTMWFSESGDTIHKVIADQSFNFYDGIPVAIDTSKIGGAIPYYQIDVDKFHNVAMKALKDSIYAITYIPDSCYCKAGNVEAGFYIRKDGSITDISMGDDFDPAITEIFKQSLVKLKHWPAPTKNGKPCDGYFIEFFHVEKAKRK